MTRLTDRLRRPGLPWRVAATLLAVLVALAALRSSAIEWNDVASPSMRPSILEGDRILVWKLAYEVRVPFTDWTLWRRANPRRGDVVVFDDGSGSRLVKRVIGLPGDRVEVRGHLVLLDGRPLDREPVAAASTPPGHALYREGGPTGYPVLVADTSSPAADSAAITVPAGRFFVLGDNRGHSLDSRQLGTVPRERIIGRAVAVALSYDFERGGRLRAGRYFTPLR